MRRRATFPSDFPTDTARQRGRKRRRLARQLRHLKKVKPSRRHVETALMATVPSAALFGFAAQHHRASPPTEISAPMTAVSATTEEQQALAAPQPGQERVPDLIPGALEASYYGDEFAGRATANGETFNPRLMTAAHRTLPFGTMVKVTNAITGKDVTVRINDRGPFHGNREIDVSTAAAERLGMLGSGTAKVKLEVLRQA